MKDALLTLLKVHPITAGRSNEFLDELAEDITAVIIRALVPGDPNDIIADIEHQAEGIFNDHFGVKLSNLFTMEPFDGKKELFYNARKRVVMAMLVAMLVEMNDQTGRIDSEQAGEQIKNRLADLVVSTTVN